jgi:GntR family transcriptional regulator
MDIRVDRTSDIPLHEQVAAQIVLLIGAGRVKPGAALPSVRALSQRLHVHRNTVSRAYRDLTLTLLVEKRPGRRLVVRDAEPAKSADLTDLNEFIAVTIAEARRHGHPLHEFHRKLTLRIRASPLDRVLVIAEDAGLRMLFTRELAERIGCPIVSCDPVGVQTNPQRAVGALVVAPPGYMRSLGGVLPRDHPAVAITYTAADELIDTIRRTTTPWHIAVVSVSQYFLDIARALLAPAIGRHHSMTTYLIGRRFPKISQATELIVCDVLTAPAVRRQRRKGATFVHRVIAPLCIERIEKVMRTSQASVNLEETVSGGGQSQRSSGGDPVAVKTRQRKKG